MAMTITDETDVVIQGVGTASKASLITLGTLLLVIGVLALWASFATTLISVVAAGVLLLVGAIFQAVLAVQSRKGLEILSHALMAVLYAIAGFFLAANPLFGAISLTTLIGIFFIAGGLVRLGTALYLRYANWGWAALSGIVTFALGVFTMAYLPEMSFVLIGTLVAIDMIFLGTTLIGYGAALPSSSGVRPLKTARA
jgi:uncharacterized membrane protein HdeD (DUF308 family)